MSEPLLSAIIGALFGAVIGSFLNVCIIRLPAEQSVVSPPSRCPRCGKGVEWRDNVPVLSWLLLGGKCRGCREPISIMYPLVELATAFIWALVAWKYGLSLLALKGALEGAGSRGAIRPLRRLGPSFGLAFALAGREDPEALELARALEMELHPGLVSTWRARTRPCRP